ncbi:hypothetical protein [Streptacidiphilus rugosus]|uniref:hypothetical protein n=1 Tax=Streptacidiphilus rugosus TaxID=405783 RepID=UPI00056B1FD9|nr:hypothetical protein [Streptacidiphilus rugosus]
MGMADAPKDPVQVVASALRELRRRAHQPSLDRLAKLTAGQGARWAMPRSTIDDKLKGRTAPKAEHVLALVAAFRDHAASVGHPLPSEFCDEVAWRSEWLAMNQALVDPRSRDYAGTVAKMILSARPAAGSTRPVSVPEETSEATWVEDLLQTVGAEAAGRTLPPRDAAHVARRLHETGQAEDLELLLAAASERSAQDILTMSEAASLDLAGRLIRLVLRDQSTARMAALVTEAERHHPDEAVGLIHLGMRSRPVPGVVAVIEALRANGGSPFIGEILSAVLRERPAREAGMLLIGLRAAKLRGDAEALLYLLSLSHDPGSLLPVISLLRERRHYADARKLQAVVEPRWWRRPPARL